MSQLNGCAYCVDTHTSDALAALIWVIAVINAWNRVGAAARPWLLT